MERGFTMIEALVALVIVAVSLAAIGSVVAANFHSTRAIEARLRLVQTARALLTALPQREKLALGDLRGRIGNERWRIDVMPFSANFVDPSQPTPWLPQAVVIRVEAPGGEILRVDTVRLQRNQGSGQ